MKILFFSSQKTPKKDYATEFTHSLYTFLKKKHTVAIAKHGKKVKWNLWDMILVQDSYSLVQLKNNLKKSDVSVVFFSLNNSWQYRPFTFKNLLKVFSLNNSPVDFISPEIVRSVQRPFFFKEKIYVSKPNGSTIVKILFYYDDSEVNSRALPSVIQFANINYNSVRLTILLNRSYINTAKYWVNSTISLKETSAFPNELNSNYDLVYASGPPCLISLSLGIPTVVVGAKGYGGLVTQENFEEHITSNFQGRIGAEIGEEIPYWILADLLEDFTTSKVEINKKSSSLSTMAAKSFQPNTIFSSIENELTDLNQFHRKIKSRKGLLLLQPKIASGIFIVKATTDGMFHLINKEGLILGNISNNERIVIGQCNGINKVGTFGEVTGNSNEEIMEFITELWYNKVIYF